MFGTVIAAGTGVAAFLLGREAQRLSDEGKTTPEILSGLATYAWDGACGLASLFCRSDVSDVKASKHEGKKPSEEVVDV